VGELAEAIAGKRLGQKGSARLPSPGSPSRPSRCAVADASLDRSARRWRLVSMIFAERSGLAAGFAQQRSRMNFAAADLPPQLRPIARATRLASPRQRRGESAWAAVRAEQGSIRLGYIKCDWRRFEQASPCLSPPLAGSGRVRGRGLAMRAAFTISLACAPSAYELWIGALACHRPALRATQTEQKEC